jgi:opacity protein-like surface antigen
MVLVALLFVAVAQSQDVPKAEVFGGYSYHRADAGSGLSRINLNGWNATVTGNINSWFGITADFSGQYGTSLFDTAINRHSFLFGSRFTHRGDSGRINPFVHTLFGAVRAHRSLGNPGPLGSPLPLLPAASETAFGMALGGGLDVRVNDRFAIRVVQADYLMTRFGESSGIVCIQSITTPCPTTQAGTQHNVRLAFGGVWRFGK